MKVGKCRLALMGALAGAVLAILNVPVTVHAQSVAMSVIIPFEFQVGTKKLPAGTYIVNRRGEAIQISDDKGHNAFVLSNPVTNPAAKSDDQLVFKCYGDAYFLSEVRWNGYLNAREVTKSRTEIELAKSLATSKVLTAGVSR
jgi:hypothetical protein